MKEVNIKALEFAIETADCLSIDNILSFAKKYKDFINVVSTFYLQKYLDEFEYRYNRRNLDTKDIFNNLLMRATYGK